MSDAPDTIEVDGVLYVRAWPVAEGNCGVCGAGPRMWSPREIVDALRRHNGPSSEEWTAADGADHPAFATVRRVFGSWNAARAAAGFNRRGPGTDTYWTRERIVEAIKRWASVHGLPPTNSEWQKATPATPASRQVIAQFGSWNEAIKAAGFMLRGPWGCYLRDPSAGRRTYVKSEPIADAVRAYLGPYGNAGNVAELVGIDVAPIHRLLRGERPRLDRNVADKILTAIDRPDVAAMLEAA